LQFSTSDYTLWTLFRSYFNSIRANIKLQVYRVITVTVLYNLVFEESVHERNNSRMIYNSEFRLCYRILSETTDSSVHLWERSEFILQMHGEVLLQNCNTTQISTSSAERRVDNKFTRFKTTLLWEYLWTRYDIIKYLFQCPVLFVALLVTRFEVF
jgi:hypothetical protein